MSLTPVLESVSVGLVAVAVMEPLALVFPLTVAELTEAKAGAAARPTTAAIAAPVVTVPVNALVSLRMG